MARFSGHTVIIIISGSLPSLVCCLCSPVLVCLPPSSLPKHEILIFTFANLNTDWTALSACLCPSQVLIFFFLFPPSSCLFDHSETMSAEQRLLSIPELSHHLAESYVTCCLYLQEMLQYKRQNHGKVQYVGCDHKNAYEQTCFARLALCDYLQLRIVLIYYASACQFILWNLILPLDPPAP